MDEKEIKRGVRNAWILTLVLLLLVALGTWFSLWANRPEKPAGWAQGERPFVPGESSYGLGYHTPKPEPQE